MERKLGYGKDGAIPLEWPEAAAVRDCGCPRGEPLSDPLTATVKSLAAPLGFPPLTAATVVGDRVAIALEPGVPCADAVLAGVIRSLLATGTQPSDITVVVSPLDPDDTRDEMRRAAENETGQELRWVVHDPADFGQLAYVAASEEGDPIYVNRCLSDADVLLPIGVLRPDRAPGYLGIHGGLFPVFSDQATQERYRAGDRRDWRKNQARRRKETNEAAWLLGVQLLVQVVPGPGDRVLGVLAGDAAAVRARGRAWLEEAWRYEVSQRVGVVVASIEGGPEQQTWENVARALETAAAALADEGVIALCTSLARPPGPALRQLASGHPSAPRRKSGQAVPPDVLPAAILDEIGKQYRVFLLSDLDEETVEELGMGYIASPHEIMRLVRQFDSCLVLGNAHHAIIQVVD